MNLTEHRRYSEFYILPDDWVDRKIYGFPQRKIIYDIKSFAYYITDMELDIKSRAAATKTRATG